MFSDYFCLACAGIGFYSGFTAFKQIFQSLREKREMKRKIEWGEFVDVSTVMNNIYKLENQAIASKTSQSGKKNHLVLMRGNICSDSSITSSFDQNEKFLIKVKIS